jgi:UDP-galactopyranose mutase
MCNLEKGARVSATDLIVLSHLRWDFVYQRPQHLLGRMAASRRVFFVEEPYYHEDEPRWELSSPSPSVTVCRLLTPERAPGFADVHLPTFAQLLPQLLADQQINDYALWLYTPMALPFAQQSLQPRAVIYDCMDELAAFKGAPPALLEREAALLRWADLVFTGGPSIYRAKQDKHPRVYCFPSSVDAAHFRQALTGAEADDQQALPHPRLGFYGVIDERMDLDLLVALADAHPDWHLVLVGPVVKIDPAALPERPNIHYLGQRAYEALPGYLAGWDVCLLPFARNEATRFISPTKTLEYMAAEKPIVSTPIADVAEPYGEIVYLGATPAEFIAACERALAANESERQARIAAMREVLSRTSWDATAREMNHLIDEVLQPTK